MHENLRGAVMTALLLGADSLKQFNPTRSILRCFDVDQSRRPRLVAGEHLAASVVVADDKASGLFLDGPRRREAAQIDLLSRQYQCLSGIIY